MAGLVAAVAARRPDIEVRQAFVDVEEPRIGSVLDDLGETPTTVVPLLLSAGYHVYVDLAEATSPRTATSLAPALGPDPRLADLLHRRLLAAGLRDDDTVVMAAAGSSDPRAVVDCAEVADALGRILGRPSPAAYLSAVEPRLEAAVTAARDHAPDGGRVVVATYLLAPGYFHDLAAASGADLVTPPLLVPGEPPAEALVDIVLERYAS